jgi:hypothetical protein
LAILGNQEHWLHKTFAGIFSDEIHHTPLHPAFSSRVVNEVPRIEGSIILGGEEVRRPPSFETLKRIPFFFPQRL